CPLSQARQGLSLLQRPAIELQPIGMVEQLRLHDRAHSGIAVEALENPFGAPLDEHTAQVENHTPGHSISRRRLIPAAQYAQVVKKIMTACAAHSVQIATLQAASVVSTPDRVAETANSLLFWCCNTEVSACPDNCRLICSQVYCLHNARA